MIQIVRVISNFWARWVWTLSLAFAGERFSPDGELSFFLRPEIIFSSSQETDFPFSQWPETMLEWRSSRGGRSTTTPWRFTADGMYERKNSWFFVHGCFLCLTDYFSLLDRSFYLCDNWTGGDLFQIYQKEPAAPNCWRQDAGQQAPRRCSGREEALIDWLICGVCFPSCNFTPIIIYPYRFVIWFLRTKIRRYRYPLRNFEKDFLNCSEWSSAINYEILSVRAYQSINQPTNQLIESPTNRFRGKYASKYSISWFNSTSLGLQKYKIGERKVQNTTAEKKLSNIRCAFSKMKFLLNCRTKWTCLAACNFPPSSFSTLSAAPRACPWPEPCRSHLSRRVRRRESPRFRRCAHWQCRFHHP